MKHCLAILAALCLLLTACGSSPAAADPVSAAATPEDAVNAAFTAVKNGDWDTADILMGGQMTAAGAEDGIALSEMSAFFSRLEWRVLSSDDNGDGTAMVTAEVSNADAAAVMTDCLDEVLAWKAESMTLPVEQQPTDDELLEKIFEVMSAGFTSQDYALVTAAVEIPLTETEGCWVIDENASLIDAMMGGLNTYLASS